MKIEKNGLAIDINPKTYAELGTKPKVGDRIRSAIFVTKAIFLDGVHILTPENHQLTFLLNEVCPANDNEKEVLREKVSQLEQERDELQDALAEQMAENSRVRAKARRQVSRAIAKSIRCFDAYNFAVEELLEEDPPIDFEMIGVIPRPRPFTLWKGKSVIKKEPAK